MDIYGEAPNNYIEATGEIIFERFGKPIIYTEDEIIEQVDVFVDEQLEKGRIPTIEGFVLHLKVSIGSFRSRRAHIPVIGMVCDYILLQQKEEAIQSGFLAKNSRFHEFILNVNHGMKVEDQSNAPIQINVQNPEIVRRLKKIEDKMQLTNGKTPTIIDVTDFELD